MRKSVKIAMIFTIIFLPIIIVVKAILNSVKPIK